MTDEQGLDYRQNTEAEEFWWEYYEEHIEDDKGEDDIWEGYE